MPIFFHNFSRYDAHAIITEVANYEPGSNLTVLPSDTQSYISVTKSIKVNRRLLQDKKGRRTNQLYLKLSFRDSFRFLSSSLDTLSKNLNYDDFKFTRAALETKLRAGNVNVSEEDVKRTTEMMLRKGVFPYEFVTSFDSYNTVGLPQKTAFNSCMMEGKEISDAEYEFAKTVFDKFKCQTVGDYSDIYLQCDVTILADIMTNFRKICMKNYELDPANYCTTPSLAWDAMMKMTGVELDLLQDFEMIKFIRDGMRGGYCGVVHRDVTALNQHTTAEPVVDPNYLLYVDYNALYSSCSTLSLPEKEFEWVTEAEVRWKSKINKIPNLSFLFYRLKKF